MAQAQAKPELDLDAQKPASNKKHLVLYILIGALMLGLGIALTMLLMKGDKPAEGAAAEPAQIELKPATYLALKPFVVNFAQKGPARFLQVEVQVMAAEPAVLAAVETHMPVIRNDINMLLASQTFEVVSTREGKEALREEIKTSINRILETQQVQGTVEGVYFTSFVMQ